MKRLNISLSLPRVRQKLFAWAVFTSASAALAQPSSVRISLSGQPLNSSDGTHPYADYSASVGANLILKTAVIGTPPFSYQWLFNGASLLNQTNFSLNLNAVQATNKGSYAVVVSNAGDISTDVGYNGTAIWGDHDNDGYSDLFVPIAGGFTAYLTRAALSTLGAQKQLPANL